VPLLHYYENHIEILMKKITLVFMAIWMFGVLTGCSTAATFDAKASSTPSQDLYKTDRLLVKSANIEIEVENVKAVVGQIEEEVKRVSGFVNDVYDRDETRVSMSLKVPAGDLDAFMDSIGSKGDIVSKSLSVSDVTDEVIDIEARLVNLKALRDRFRKLLDKADKVADILKIENELTRIQIEIDSIESRNKSLKDQVSLSRVDVTITQKKVYGPLGYLGWGLYWLVEKLFVIK